MNDNIKQIVLTGGPCAGKTTIFKKIEKYLLDKGYYVITVPETATELIKGRVLPNSDREHTLMFQDLVLKQQYTKELVAKIYAEKIAKNNNVIILYDRAIIDNRAYLDSEDDFEYILNNNNLNEYQILHQYDLVIDLISTATCMPDNYKLDGVRFETVEEAKILDQKTGSAWLHHPNLKIVKPQTNIDDKFNIVVNHIDNLLKGVDYHNKQLYYLDSKSDLSIYNDNNSKIVDVYTMYLKNNLTVVRKKYRQSEIYMLLDSYNGNKYKIITPNEFIELVYCNDVIFTETKKEINFMNNGEIYKLISDDKGLYLECDYKDNLLLPGNLFLKEDYKLVKKKNCGMI